MHCRHDTVSVIMVADDDDTHDERTTDVAASIDQRTTHIAANTDDTL